MGKINFYKLTFAILISLSAGFLGSFFTVPSIDTWYQTLNKPFFNPPNFVFGPVWTVLYLLMGISLYLIWNLKTSKKKLAIKIFFVQLFLNFSWSVVFFGFQNIGLAVVNIAVLWIFLALTIKLFEQLSKTASYLLYPYLTWISFATILNIAIVLLN